MPVNLNEVGMFSLTLVILTEQNPHMLNSWLSPIFWAFFTFFVCV